MEEEDLIPHSEVQENVMIIRNTATPETVENNHTSAPNANANFVTPVNNVTTVFETKAKNKIASIEADKKSITPNEIITYAILLDKKNTDTLDADLGMVKFCFWLQDKDRKTVPL